MSSIRLKMDLVLLSKGFDFAKRRKKWVVLLTVLGVSSYSAYKVYNSPSLSSKRTKVLNLIRALFSVAELISDSAETVGLVSNELNEFLRSDSDEIPNSLRQVAKIVRSDEFSGSVTRVSEGLCVGLLRGCRSELVDESELEESTSFADRVVEKIFSNAGTGFASVVIGSFARNIVLGFYSCGASSSDSNGNRITSDWVDLICDDKCKNLTTNCIQVFVSSAVEVYLDKTLHINTYDEVFAGLTNPKHESKIQELIVSVCNNAVETLIKTSHLVLTSKNSNSDPASYNVASTNLVGPSEMNEGSQGDGGGGGGGGGGWGGMVMSTLSVPRNQRFVCNVTGRVTFETFRSCVEFVLLKLSDGVRSSGGVVQRGVVRKGRQVVGLVGLKSFVSIVICLALYLHISSSKAFLPA